MQASTDVAISLKTLLAVVAAGVPESFHSFEINQPGIGKGKLMLLPVDLVFIWVKLYLHKVIVLQKPMLGKLSVLELQ